MIKRILVALDADTDTPVATRYAVEIARRSGAAVSGMAVVDMGSIEKDAKGGGIGSMYLMEKVEATLTAETRAVATGLLDAFRSSMQGASVMFEAHIEEGVPVDRIIDEGNYCDLFVIGKEPHFYYSHPHETSMTLADVIKRAAGPTLVVPGRYRDVARVLVAFSASQACVRSLRSFVHLKPFGTDVALDIVSIHRKSEAQGAQIVLRQAQRYAQEHGFAADIYGVLGSDPAKEILHSVDRFDSGLVVAGAHFVTLLFRLAFGSTTASLIKRVPVPMWVAT